jgi:hypothetical protein
MDLPKEILDMIEEITKDTDDIDKASGDLFPFNQGETDIVFEEKIMPSLSEHQIKYFQSALIKLKNLWYIHNKIDELDDRYLEFINFCITRQEFRTAYFKKAEQDSPYIYILYPHFEAIEFENILSQGKSCLDCFSRAVGSLFENEANNIDKLKNVLEDFSHKDPKAAAILNVIQSEEKKLRGITLRPNKENKKSLRDIINHRQKAPISFYIYKGKEGEYSTTSGAILDMHHPHIELMENYLVKIIATRIWYYSLKMVSDTFRELIVFQGTRDDK